MRAPGCRPESREARDLIAYLHRSRDEMEEVKRQAREELAQLEAERRALQTEWVERQKKRIAELEKNFRETQKRLESEVARLAADIKDRALRAQIEKQSGRRMGKDRLGGARGSRRGGGGNAGGVAGGSGRDCEARRKARGAGAAFGRGSACA